jgi:hypothetical protein
MMLKEETVPSLMPMTKNASAINDATTSTPQSMRNIIPIPTYGLPAGWIFLVWPNPIPQLQRWSLNPIET